MSVTHPVLTTTPADVLVVGAGPVGLVLAAALAHHGVRADVVDRRTAPRDSSRANNLWARPQELLAAVGLRDLLARGAHEVVRAEFVIEGRPVDTVRFTDAASPYPAVLYGSQAGIERRVREVLADQGRPVQGGTRLESLEQDDDGVDVVLRGDDGTVARRRYRYVVGADGADSAVRAAVGLDLPRQQFPGRATRQIDAVLSWRRSPARDTLWFFVYRRGLAGVMPIEGDRHRLFFVEDDAVMPDREPTLAEMQERAREVTGDPTLTLSDPGWTSHTRFEHGVAAAHAVGRVLLAGDAGHVNLPIGGQGMNAGIQDALGLAWRIAMTLDGGGGEVVLDSYAVERQAEHRRLGRQQVRGFDRLMYRSRWQDEALRLVAATVPDIGTRLLGAEELQQLSVAYPDSPLNEDHLGRRPRNAPRAGDRAPDAHVVGPDGAATLFRHLYDAGDAPTWSWSLLAFDGGDRATVAALRRAAEAAARRGIRVHLVLADPGSPGADAGVVLRDVDLVAHRAYGLRRRPALVLVRPDGHIAFRAGHDDAARLTAYWRRIVGPAPAPGERESFATGPRPAEPEPGLAHA
ncbi:FAD-dependent monooxygenase [Actinomycetospora sp. CA-084318]|uniref:FAD-dependent monooxygenase n=1 Tax=Actinomycetospora sp. CA-084318 TaxID=3239892 RepID=UPI003D97440E